MSTEDAAPRAGEDGSDAPATGSGAPSAGDAPSADEVSALGEARVEDTPSASEGPAASDSPAEGAPAAADPQTATTASVSAAPASEHPTDNTLAASDAPASGASAEREAPASGTSAEREAPASSTSADRTAPAASEAPTADASSVSAAPAASALQTGDTPALSDAPADRAAPAASDTPTSGAASLSDAPTTDAASGSQAPTADAASVSDAPTAGAASVGDVSPGGAHFVSEGPLASHAPSASDAPRAGHGPALAGGAQAWPAGVGEPLSPPLTPNAPSKQGPDQAAQVADAKLPVAPTTKAAEKTTWLALPTEADRPWSRWLGALAFTAAFAFALVTRLAYLDAKPLHHDEGVNAHFLFGLLSEGRYHYDPTNYHGPFLYFLGYLPFKVWDSTPLGLRILPALCGALTLLLLLPLRRLMGWAGVACAAWLLAISPISTYVARTAIHETYFAAAVVAAVVVVVAYSERRRSWLPTAAGLAVALAYANKETAVISYGAYVCGLGLALLFAKELRGGLRARLSWALQSFKDTWGKTASWYPPVPHWIPAVAFLLLVAVGYLIGMGGRVLLFGEESDNSWQAYARLIEFAPAPAVGVLWAGLLGLCGYLLWGLRHELKRYWREQPTTRRPWLIAIYLAATLMVILFSSLFSSVPGLTGLLSSLYHWVKRGVAMEKTGHEHPWPYYFKLLWRFEAPLMLLAPIGIVVAALRRRAGDLMILGWGLSTIAVYTVLAYKTPWLVVNLILPLALLAGIGAGALGRFLGRWRRGWGEGVLALLTTLLLIAPAVPPEPARQIESWERATTWPTLVASPSWPYLGPGEPPLVVRASKNEEDPWAHWRPEAAWWRLQWSLNVLSPDDSRYGPVYAQTDRGAVALFEHLRREVVAGKKLSVVCSEYWPLPAYLYPGRANGYPSSIPEELGSDLYLLSQDQDNKAYERFRGWGRRVFPLRTGVKLVLRTRAAKRSKKEK